MGLGLGFGLGLVLAFGLVAAQEALADDEGVGFVTDALEGEEGDEQGGGGEQTGDETGEGVAAGAEEGANDGHQQGGAAGGATGAENGETGGEAGGLEVVGVGSGLGDFGGLGRRSGLSGGFWSGWGGFIGSGVGRVAAFVPDEDDETD